MKTRSTLWWITLHLTSLVLVASFFSLGQWQLHRAADLKASVKPVADIAEVPLSQILSVGQKFSSMQSERRVTVSGKYIANFYVVDAGTRSEVSLLETTSGSILVLRGVGQPAQTNEDVTIGGRLTSPSSDGTDSNTNGPDQLSRIDPVLIAGQFDQLMNGYITAYAERGSTASSMKFALTESAPLPIKKVPGFYWQHLLYVVLWWMLILMVIYLWARTIRLERKIGMLAEPTEGTK
ncbi:MAG: SURF1 family cytochrome oxidase biogenesis protein [Actinomycetes bacterium]